MNGKHKNRFLEWEKKEYFFYLFYFLIFRINSKRIKPFEEFVKKETNEQKEGTNKSIVVSLHFSNWRLLSRVIF